MEPEFLRAPPIAAISEELRESSKAPRDGAERIHPAFCEIQFESPGDSVLNFLVLLFLLSSFLPALVAG